MPFIREKHPCPPIELDVHETSVCLTGGYGCIALASTTIESERQIEVSLRLNGNDKMTYPSVPASEDLWRMPDSKGTHGATRAQVRKSRGDTGGT